MAPRWAWSSWIVPAFLVTSPAPRPRAELMSSENREHTPAQPRVISRRQKVFVRGRIHVGRVKSAGVPLTRTRRGPAAIRFQLCARHCWGEG